MKEKAGMDSSCISGNSSSLIAVNTGCWSSSLHCIAFKLQESCKKTMNKEKIAFYPYLVTPVRVVTRIS